MYQADDEVGMEDQPGVDKSILARVSRRAKEDIGFRLFVRKSDGGGAIGQTTDDDLQDVRLHQAWTPGGYSP